VSGVLLVSFPCHWRTVCKISSQWEAKAEEMSQTLLTNKEAKNFDEAHAANITKPF
jgi:hypothetical protein